MKLLLETPLPANSGYADLFFYCAVLMTLEPPLDNPRKSLITGSFENYMSASCGSSISSGEKFKF
jgi:hypothetical protein